MDQDQLLFIGLIGIAAVSVVAVIYVLLAPFITGERRAEQRFNSVTELKRCSARRSPVMKGASST